MATPWLDEHEQRAWRGLIALRIGLDARLRRSLQRDSGLSDADYMVLVELSESATGRLRAFELVSALRWEKSRLSHHLRRMQHRGLVERVGCETDRRGAFVVLTPVGRSTIEGAAPGHVAEVRRSFFDALSPAQVEAFTEISAAVLRHLADLDSAESEPDADPGGAPSGRQDAGSQPDPARRG